MSEFGIIESKIQAGKAHIKQRIKKEEPPLQSNQETMDAEALMDIFTMTKCAQREWENAWAFFNEAKDEDMIEEAIYELMAAEHRYNYFLKLAKAQNIRNGGVPK